MSNQKKINEVEPLSFFSWYRNQQNFRIKDVRESIIEKCLLIKEPNGRCFKFENWMLGKANVPPLAQKQINELAEMELDFTIPASLKENFKNFNENQEA